MDTIEDLKTQLYGLGELVRAHATGIKARLDEVEQKLARRGADPTYRPGGGQSLGAAVTGSDSFRQWREAGAVGRTRIQVPMSALITSAPSGGAPSTLVGPDFQPGIVTLPQRRLTIRALLAPGQTTSNSVWYTKETGFSNNAAVVSEGQLKPESQITFELKQANVATIAHWVSVSKQSLDDATALSAMLDNTLRYGLGFAEETQLLYGDGTGVNLHGIIPQASAYAPAFTPTSPNALDDIALALLQSELALLPATGIVVHPTDYRRMSLLKSTTQEYLGAGPWAAGPATLWSLPVVPTPAITQGSFLVGAFGIGAQIFDRELAEVILSSEDSDNFRRNLVTALAEERLALTVQRPEAFVFGHYSHLTG